MDVTLLRTLGRAWWLVLLRGIAAVIFGILAWTWPGATLLTLTLFWGAYALVDGVAALWGGWQTKDGGRPMWQIVLVGLLGIAAGIFTFISPALTAIALLILIAVWAIVNGVFEIAAAIRLRKEISNEWLLILSGALSIAFGVLMIANPGAGAMAVLWLIGAFAVIYGVLLIALSFKLRGHRGLAPSTA
ncbi:MAG TPA: HdeD family acid-resistance protein [Casimicrobiaceae bacterium]|nr:HdeD family acid-resistance protein [Casimicrobiaceae bacterium]